MANDIAAQVVDFNPPKQKKANFDYNHSRITSTDFGFIRPCLCEEIIANSNVTLDLNAFVSTNPTISPVLSRAKFQITAWWVPTRLYVPALRDGVVVKPGKTDYAFPTVSIFNTYQPDDVTVDGYRTFYPLNLPYVPSNSIFTELQMYSPNYLPGTFYNSGLPDKPASKNAIPLLAYYDIFRNNYMNTQVDTAPLRLKPSRFTKAIITTSGQGGSRREIEDVQRPALDNYPTRSDLDDLFMIVRRNGGLYPQGEDSFDITTAFYGLFNSTTNQNSGNPLFPLFDVVIADAELGASSSDDKFVTSHYNNAHFGEMRTTYMNDFYTAFLSNENVEYERSTARISTEEGFVTMEQIYSMERVQNFIRRSVFRNSAYEDYIDVQYGVKPRTDISKPMFLGAISSWLTWNDVVSQAQTGSDANLESNTDLGSRAALGSGRILTGKYRGGKNRPFIRFHTKEPGYLMVLYHIVPELSYYAGFNPLYSKRTLGSLYYPSFDKDGYQDKQIQYLVENPTTLNNISLVTDAISEDSFILRLPSTSFENYNKAYAQEPAWFEYMAKPNLITGQMVETAVYLPWSFTLTGDSPYLANDDITPVELPKSLVDTYVYPERHNQIFANDNGLDNFQVFFYFDFNVYQPMSHRFLSF